MHRRCSKLLPVHIFYGLPPARTEAFHGRQPCFYGVSDTRADSLLSPGLTKKLLKKRQK